MFVEYKNYINFAQRNLFICTTEIAQDKTR